MLSSSTRTTHPREENRANIREDKGKREAQKTREKESCKKRERIPRTYEYYCS